MGELQAEIISTVEEEAASLRVLTGTPISMKSQYHFLHLLINHTSSKYMPMPYVKTFCQGRIWVI